MLYSVELLSNCDYYIITHIKGALNEIQERPLYGIRKKEKNASVSEIQTSKYVGIHTGSRALRIY